MAIATTRKLRTTHLWLNDDDDFEGHGAAILLLVRDEVVRDWKSLCHILRFDRDKRPFHSGHLALKHTIDELVEAGLLESAREYFGPYKPTDLAFTTIGALGISLTQAANMPNGSGLAVRPVFGKPARLPRAAHAFVIMPFNRGLRRVYDGPVKAACGRSRLTVERSDEIFSPGKLVRDIWNAIVNCFVVIADCTDRNPNVFYELGIAHTLGKPAILITQRESDVPSDVDYFRYIKYSTTAAGFRQLEGALHRTLRETTKTVWAAT
jgi:hypothetical protein